MFAMNIWVRIVAGLILIAAAALLVGGIVHEYESFVAKKVAEGEAKGETKKQAEWDKDIKKRDAEKLAAVAAAVKKTQTEAAAAVQGERDARDKAERQAAASKVAASRSTAASNSLLDSSNTLDRVARAIGIPNAAACPGEFIKQRDAAMRARAVLGSCTTEYRDLGQTIDESWRAVTLKLDTALSYISAVSTQGEQK